MREIYLDNAATTRCFPQVVEKMSELMLENYGNPSSKHIKGLNAERSFTEARELIARTLKAKPKEIIFTSGGTESNNMALIGGALAKRRQGRHIIASCIEHAAVYKPLDFLAEEGWEISYLPVDERGHVSQDALRASLRPDTVLVSIMSVNNEIGAIEPVEALAAIVKAYNPRILFHTDAIQAYGKLKLAPGKSGIDLLSASGHKLHGPKGIGFLYVREGVRLRPLIYGGGQQEDMRSGTHALPGIAGMALAAQLMYGEYAPRVAALTDLKDTLIERLRCLEGVRVNSEKGSQSAPQIVSASFEGVRAEVLLHALEEKGIYVSSGSACSSNHPGISGTLRAIGLPDKLLDATLRFSFGCFSSLEDVEECVEALKALLPQLRRFVRR